MKTIIVHLHDLQRAGRLLAAAVPLAAAHQAHLIGVAILPPFVAVPAPVSTGVSVTIDEHRVSYRREMDQLRSMFDSACSGHVFGHEWRDDDAGFGTVSGRLVEHARSADLVILAKRRTDWAYGALLEEPDRVVIECGRPVLVVPVDGAVQLPCRQALIAWNGRREAARAAFDALPLLGPGCAIALLCVDTASDPADAAAGADLAVALARYNHKCEVAQMRGQGASVGELILREGKARGADLIVMGAYGHSRLREMLLGGATRDVLAATDRPLLLSH